jgi:hypothetical protein
MLISELMGEGIGYRVWSLGLRAWEFMVVDDFHERGGPANTLSLSTLNPKPLTLNPKP